VAVTVDNPLAIARAAETVAVTLKDLRVFSPNLDPHRTIVKNAKGVVILSQWVDVDGDDAVDELVFQADLAAKQSAKFQIEPGERAKPTRANFKAFGRFVRERHDDFAWENDRVAHRMYGPGLETGKPDPLTSSGIDVWSKVKGTLVVNDWYLVNDYHLDHGQGGDFYSVKTTRGVGGTAIQVGDTFVPSRNFVASRVYANGPLRLIFELDFAPWNAGGALVSETKRITLDAGAHFNQVESTFRVAGAGPAPKVGIAIVKHEGATVIIDRKKGLIRGWEPLFQPGKKPVGNLGSAILADPQSVVGEKATDTDHWLVAQSTDKPLRFAFGTAWDRGGDIKNQVAWEKYVEENRERFLSPVEIRLTAADRTKR
jgi:hypothetical protein